MSIKEIKSETLYKEFSVEIPYNEIDGEFQRPNQNQIQTFMNKLRSARFPVTIRWSKGTDIDAGCGQLAIKNNSM